MGRGQHAPSQALEAELEDRRGAIARAEARAEELQEKIRLESVDAGELARRHRLASQAADRIDSAALVMRERRRGAQARAAELEVSLEANKAKRPSPKGTWRRLARSWNRCRASAAAPTPRPRGWPKRPRRSPAGAPGWNARRPSWAGRAGQLDAALDAARREQAQTQEALSNGLAHVKLIEGHGKELGLQLERAQQDAEALAQAAASGQQALAELEAREAAARARVGEAFQAREEARGAADAARDEERAVASEIKGIEEVERASAAAAGPALSWLLEHEAELQAGLAPLAHAVSAPVARRRWWSTCWAPT